MIKRIYSKTILTFFLSLLLIITLSGQALALMQKLELNELTDQSDSIITGTIAELNSQWDTEQGNIFTTVTVNVDSKIKGEEKPGIITVMIPGGTVDGITQIVSDTPEFRVGEEVVLFLNELPWYKIIFTGSASNNFYEMCGNFQGKFSIIDNNASGIPLEEFEEEINLLLETDQAESNLDPLEDEPYFVSNHAFVTLPFRWTGLSPVVPYYVNASSARITEINAAAGSWSNAGANFAFNYRGTHSRSGGPLYNGTNEIMWRDLGTNNALAIASIWVAGNTIMEADMSFNTRYNWSTSGSIYDVQTVALHEFGHWVGLDHSSTFGSIMYYQYKGTQRSLHQDDIAGIRYIYGNSGLINPCNVSVPNRPEGPSSGIVGTTYNYTASGSSCSNSHNLEYKFYFSDNTESNWRTFANCNKYWSSPGSHSIRVQTRCSIDNNSVSSLSEPLVVTVTNAPVYYDLTLSIEGEGTTSPVAGTHTYLDGTSITLEATPNDGWQFDKWIINHEEIFNRQASFSINRDTLARVVFSEIDEPVEDDNHPDDQSNGDGDNGDENSFADHQVTIIIEGQGTTDPSEGIHYYSSGEDVQLTAYPAENWILEKWVVEDEEHNEPSIMLRINNNLTINAVFSDRPEIIEDDADQNQDNSGSESGENTGSTGNNGTTDGGSNGSGSETNTTPPPPPAAPVNPSPAVTQHQLSIAVNGEGSVHPAPGTHTYNKDSEVNIKAESAEGWIFIKWIIDGREIASQDTSIKIDRDLSATAYFTRQKRGDITNDGNVTVSDVVRITRYSLGIYELTEEQKLSADVNGDGVVDVKDITLIMQYALGLIDSFPVDR